MLKTFSTAIIKIVEVCNLDCSYCYMYHLNDRTFTRMPRFMSLDTAVRAVDQIAIYCNEIGRREFTVCLHGGEPTLWPHEFFASLLSHIQQVQDSHGISIEVVLQTNGYRMPRDLIDLLVQYHVLLGISIDGPQAYHDSRRRLRNGHPTYKAVMNTVAGLLDRGYPPQWLSFLSVVNVSMTPQEYLDWADSLPVRRVDVLWPMWHNYDNPPWINQGLDEYIQYPVYGSWFAELFKLWFLKDDPTLEIRGFFDIVGVMLGAVSHGDDLVNDSLPMFVVETDGTYCYHDYIRGIADRSVTSTLNVATSPLSELARDAVVEYYLNLGRDLPKPCNDCKHVDTCGGGFLPGRLSSENAPYPVGRSVFCLDHYRLLEGIHNLLFDERSSDAAGTLSVMSSPPDSPLLHELAASLARGRRFENNIQAEE